MNFDKAYIKSRIDRSKESLDEARLLYDNGHYLTVINRLYYAVFYIACAYLGKKEIATKTHSGTKAKFHEYFLKPGIVSNSFGELYTRLFRERNDTDYGDFASISKDEAEEMLDEAEQQLQTLWENFDNEL